MLPVFEFKHALGHVHLPIRRSTRGLVIGVGIEPTTHGLKIRCSTTELPDRVVTLRHRNLLEGSLFCANQGAVKHPLKGRIIWLDIFHEQFHGGAMARVPL